LFYSFPQAFYKKCGQICKKGAKKYKKRVFLLPVLRKERFAKCEIYVAKNSRNRFCAMRCKNPGRDSEHGSGESKTALCDCTGLFSKETEI